MKHITAQGMLLRIESLAILALALVAYSYYGFSWWVLVVLFLVPDLAAFGYLAGPKVGAAVYNAVHTHTAPVLFGTLALLLGWQLGLQLALIWVVHIAVDRLVGYGLKYSTGFKNTHLSQV